MEYKTIYVQEKECYTTYIEECKPSKPSYNYKNNYKKHCKKVPHQACDYIDVPKMVPEKECHYVTIPVCKNVPNEHCSTYTVPNCTEVPEEVCETEYKEECHTVPVEVPIKKKTAKCSWPEYREYEDSDLC